MSYEPTRQEELLVAECVKGNPTYQKKLFEKYYSKMLAVCLRYTKDRDDAKDVLQDGFVKIFQGLPRWRSSPARTSLQYLKIRANSAQTVRTTHIVSYLEWGVNLKNADTTKLSGQRKQIDDVTKRGRWARPGWSARPGCVAPPARQH